MSVFKDSSGNSWEIRFNTPSIIKITRRMNLMVQDLISLKIPVADMLEAFPVLIESQLKEKGLTPEKFLEAMSPADLTAAAKAMGEAIREAFPSIVINKGGGVDGVPFVPGS